MIIKKFISEPDVQYFPWQKKWKNITKYQTSKPVLQTKSKKATVKKQIAVGDASPL